MDRKKMRRLEEVEKRQSPVVHKPIALVYVNPIGHPDGKDCLSDRAEGGDYVWLRRAEETQEQFKRRVMTEAEKLPTPPAFVSFCPRPRKPQTSRERLLQAEKYLGRHSCAKIVQPRNA
jgi:hypothetical protein